MPKWQQPALPDGPLQELNEELLRLHAYSGHRSSYKIADWLKARAANDPDFPDDWSTPSHAWIHSTLTSLDLPNRPTMISIVEAFVALGSIPNGRKILDKVDQLWPRPMSTSTPRSPNCEPPVSMSPGSPVLTRPALQQTCSHWLLQQTEILGPDLVRVENYVHACQAACLYSWRTPPSLYVVEDDQPAVGGFSQPFQQPPPRPLRHRRVLPEQLDGDFGVAGDDRVPGTCRNRHQQLDLPLLPHGMGVVGGQLGLANAAQPRQHTRRHRGCRPGSDWADLVGIADARVEA